MRIPRFYQPDPLNEQQTLALSSQNFRHAIQVLRLQAGDALVLFNGRGGEFSAQLQSVTKRSAHVKIIAYQATERESKLDLQLLLALIKPDKMDMALQKATELGVKRIQPLITQRTVVQLKASRLAKKMQHWEAVTIAACEQSGRTQLPEIAAPVSLQQYLASPRQGICLALSPLARQSIQTLDIPADSAIDLLIGPEGGFSTAEMTAIEQHKALSVSLGPRILRAETAAIAAISLIQSRYGDLG